MKFFQRQSPGRLITFGFACVILLGSILLVLPISWRQGESVSYIDALFTSTSAVCVTGLIAVDTADTFNAFGQTIVAVLIQIGGLGVTCVGVSFLLAMGRRVGFKQRVLIKESLNLESRKGLILIVKKVLFMTLCFEVSGVVLSYLVFRQDYSPLRALGISMFHSIAAFNNSGFDILGNLQNLIPYQNNLWLNVITCLLIIFGGLGFLVIDDIVHTRSFRKLELHSKVVIVTSIVLIILGAVLLKITENISWMGAFFHSVSARTAGFSTYPLGKFTNAGLLVLIVLMFIGASPGSTGGGIKTSTLFTMLQMIRSVATNQPCNAFHYRIPAESYTKASIITLLSGGVVIIGTFILCILEPNCSLVQTMFEVTSAFGTVGLSTGITPDLCDLSKLVLVVIMFIGRLGPLTIASIWVFKRQTNLNYPKGNIMIG